MKKLIVFAVILSLAMTSIPAFAAKGRKGASDRAYEQASDEAVFHRVGDWFATVGKSEEEKAAIKAERKTARTVKRLKKEAEKKKKEMKKESKKAGKAVSDKMKGMKKKFGQ